MAAANATGSMATLPLRPGPTDAARLLTAERL